MIELHNKSTYRRIYKTFSTIFIDSFCSFRRSGHNTKESLAAAKISVQTHLVDELVKNNMNPDTIVKAIEAYINIKNDSELIDKAIRYFQSMK